MVSFAVLLTSLLAVFMVKEPSAAHDRTGYTAIASDGPEETESLSPTAPVQHLFPNLWDLTRFKESVPGSLKYFRKPVLVFSLWAFFLKRVAFTSENFVFQYASEKFGWPLRQTVRLGFAAAVGAVVATMIVNLLLNFSFANRGYDVHKLDYAVVVGSLLIAASAMFGIWVSSEGEQLLIGMYSWKQLSKNLMSQ